MKRLDLDLAAALELALEQLLAVLVVAGVDGLAALGQAVERRHGEEEVAVADELRHLAIEEGDEQRGDVGAVDVGVGHDDDPVVAEVVVAVAGAGADAERLDEVGELLVLATASRGRRWRR